MSYDKEATANRIAKLRESQRRRRNAEAMSRVARSLQPATYQDLFAAEVARRERAAQREYNATHNRAGDPYYVPDDNSYQEYAED